MKRQVIFKALRQHIFDRKGSYHRQYDKIVPTLFIGAN
jgi:hypothetical protein